MLHFKREAVLITMFLFLPLAPLLFYYIYGTFFDPKIQIGVTEGKLLVMRDALLDFKEDVGRLPTNKENLQILIHNKTQLTNWKGPYASEDWLIDGWNTLFTYQRIQEVTYVGSPGKNKSFETKLGDIKVRRSRGDDILLFLEDGRGIPSKIIGANLDLPLRGRLGPRHGPPRSEK